MCLSVFQKFHGDFFKKEMRPLVAPCDLKVYKVLTPGPFGYYTPVMHHRVMIEKGRGFLHSPMELYYSMFERYLSPTIGTPTIGKGIHSFYRKGGLMFDTFFKTGLNNKCFTAIIPKGTEFYIGIDEDIVSERLIIYFYEESIPECKTAFQYIQEKNKELNDNKEIK